MTTHYAEAVAEIRARQLRGLVELTEFLTRNPAVPIPNLLLHAFVDTKQEVAEVARYGPWQKEYDENFFSLRREFTGGVSLLVNVARSTVCVRVVVGTRIEPAKPERTVDVVEWKCEPSLLEGGV